MAMVYKRKGEKIMKDKLWLGIPVAVYLFIFGLGMFKNVEAAEWNDKPVMCEQKEIFEKTMVERGEILFSRGDMLATVRTKDGLSDIPAILPVRMYINPQKKTFTIVEYHIDYNSMCVLAFGNNWSSVGTSM